MQSTIRRSSLALLVLLAACSGGTEPKPSPVGVQKVAKVSGDAQTSKVTTKLGQPLVAFAYLDTTKGGRAIKVALSSSSVDTTAVFNLGVPLTNRVISFVVPDPTCGAPFSNSEITDATGVVKQLWTAGTKASVDCMMEARAVDQATGLPVTYAVFHATFKAFPVTQATIQPLHRFARDSVQLSSGATWTAIFADGDTLDLAKYIVKAFDQYANVNTDYLTRTSVRTETGTTTPEKVVGLKRVLHRGDMFVAVYLDSTRIGDESRIIVR
jgi:hypothetical protein